MKAPALQKTATPLALPDIDINRLLFDASTLFNPLHHESLLDCQAVEIRDGRVILNVALPQDMTRFFIALLESMTGFFRVMQQKTRVVKAQGKCIDPVEIEQRESRKREYAEEVCSLFDGFVTNGHEMTEAIRLTNSALKAKSHPWATYHLVSSVLRSEGRLRKRERKERKNA
jgi:hypothetical protein